MTIFKYILNTASFCAIFFPTILSWLFLVDESTTEKGKAGAILFGLFITLPAWIIVSAIVIGLVYLFAPEFLLNFDIMDKDMLQDRIKRKSNLSKNS